MGKMILYHGTTNAVVGKGCKTLLPSDSSGVLRESREGGKGIVFMTDSMASAEKYALKAAAVFGGVPTVYEVRPSGRPSVGHNHEFTSESATVVRLVRTFARGHWSDVGTSDRRS
jgi:hypothetical protein